MLITRSALLQLGAVRSPSTCRQKLARHPRPARDGLSFSRRICTGGLLASVGGVISSKRDWLFHRQQPVLSVNAERVYTLETRLQTGGFTEKQARALILAAATLRRLQDKVKFDDIGKVFNTAWQVEDEMLEAGFNILHARQLGLMFVSLASTKQGRPFIHDNCWDFWEVEDASRVGKYLELAGGKPYAGFELAQAILNFARQEWDT